MVPIDCLVAGLRRDHKNSCQTDASRLLESLSGFSSLFFRASTFLVMLFFPEIVLSFPHLMHLAICPLPRHGASILAFLSVLDGGV